MFCPCIPYCPVSFVYHQRLVTEPLEDEGFTTMKRPWLPNSPPRQQAIAKLFSRQRSHPRTFRPRIELLEDRLAPAVLTVNTLTDELDAPSSENGFLSLREAITSINKQADFNTDATNNRVGGYASTPGGTADVINFNIPGAGVRTIAVGTDPTATGIAEPDIIMPLTIDGYSQTGASVNTRANSDNA